MGHMPPSTRDYAEDSDYSDDERWVSSSSNELTSNSGDDTHIEQNTQLKMNYRSPYVQDHPEDSEDGDDGQESSSTHGQTSSSNESTRNTQLASTIKTPQVREAKKLAGNHHPQNGYARSESSRNEFPRSESPRSESTRSESSQNESSRSEYSRSGSPRSDSATVGSVHKSSWRDRVRPGHHRHVSPETGFYTSDANDPSRFNDLRNSSSAYDTGLRSILAWASLVPEACLDPPETLPCKTCTRPHPPALLRKLRCGHHHCVRCLENGFNVSLNRPDRMPPRCCCGVSIINIRRIADTFSEQFKLLWYQAFYEYTRVTCPRQDCRNSFLPINPERSRWVPKSTRCNRCGTHICLFCKGYLHGLLEECPYKTALQAVYIGSIPAGEPITSARTGNDSLRHSPYPQPQAEPATSMADRARYAPLVNTDEVTYASPSRPPRPPSRAYVRSSMEHHRART